MALNYIGKPFLSSLSSMFGMQSHQHGRMNEQQSSSHVESTTAGEEKDTPEHNEIMSIVQELSTLSEDEGSEDSSGSTLDTSETTVTSGCRSESFAGSGYDKDKTHYQHVCLLYGSTSSSTLMTSAYLTLVHMLFAARSMVLLRTELCCKPSRMMLESLCALKWPLCWIRPVDQLALTPRYIHSSALFIQCCTDHIQTIFVCACAPI
jgi:hypothetical protein